MVTKMVQGGEDVHRSEQGEGQWHRGGGSENSAGSWDIGSRTQSVGSASSLEGEKTDSGLGLGAAVSSPSHVPCFDLLQNEFP